MSVRPDNLMQPIDLVISNLEQIVREFFRILPQISLALLVLLLTFFLARLAARLVARATRRSKMRPALIVLLDNLAAMVTWIAGLLLASIIAFPQMNPADAVAALGIGSVALGFAFRNTLENFIAGIIVLSRKAMRIGDIVHAADYLGRVERITVRETHLRQLDGQLVILPNNLLFQDPVRILTDWPQRRQEVVVQVAYDTDLRHAHGVLTEALREPETIDRTRDVEIYAVSFDADGISFLIRWWTGSTPIEAYRSASEVVMVVHAALNAAGIEIPFPQRTLSFKEPVPLSQASEGLDPAA